MCSMFFALQGFTKEFMVMLKDGDGSGVEYLGIFLLVQPLYDYEIKDYLIIVIF